MSKFKTDALHITQRTTKSWLLRKKCDNTSHHTRITYNCSNRAYSVITHKKRQGCEKRSENMSLFEATCFHRQDIQTIQYKTVVNWHRAGNNHFILLLEENKLQEDVLFASYCKSEKYLLWYLHLIWLFMWIPPLDSWEDNIQKQTFYLEPNAAQNLDLQFPAIFVI